MWTLFKSRPLTAGGWLLTADRESHLKTPLQPFTVQSSPQIRCYNKNGKTAEDAGRNDFWQVLMYRGGFMKWWKKGLLWILGIVKNFVFLV